MTANTVRRPPISAARLVAALAAILLATAVLPPAAAWTLNSTRVAQTRERVRAATGQLKVETAGVGIVCGPGRLPDREPATARARAGVSQPAHSAWLRGARMAPEIFGPHSRQSLEQSGHHAARRFITHQRNHLYLC